MESPLIIEFKADDAIKAMQRYPARTQLATQRALNRALTTGRARMATLLAKDMGMKARDAKEAISVEEARLDKLVIRMIASLRRRPLYDFGAKGPLPSRGKGGGVSYRIGSMGRGRIKPAFIARMQSGHVGVFKRATKKRLKIIELFGPSIGHVFNKHRPAVVAVMSEAFEERLAHELRFAFKDAANG